jgi:hypothetical protein
MGQGTRNGALHPAEHPPVRPATPLSRFHMASASRSVIDTYRVSRAVHLPHARNARLLRAPTAPRQPWRAVRGSQPPSLTCPCRYRG